MSASTVSASTKKAPVQPIIDGKKPRFEFLIVHAFVLLPMLALVAAVPLAWGWGLSWLDAGLAVGFYFLSGFGITAGFHRYFTHRAFKANRALRNALAIAGSLALQGDVLTWVADHRRHHAFTDKEGDPHSPWLFGTTPAAVARGFWHSHMGWTFNRDRTNVARFAPDLLADPDVSRVARQFPWWTVVSLLSPALLGGLISMSWWGALTAFFWAGLVRVAVLHHVTWSVNSICHFFGTRRFAVEDESTNVFWLALPSFGESWHHNHHAFPRSAAHGLRWWELDLSALTIRLMRRVGLAWDVVLITPARQEQRLAAPAERTAA
jgi:stearoyl-CoA desaturase (Delta-9 desaturase)